MWEGVHLDVAGVGACLQQGPDDGHVPVQGPTHDLEGVGWVQALPERLPELVLQFDLPDLTRFLGRALNFSSNNKRQGTPTTDKQRYQPTRNTNKRHGTMTSDKEHQQATRNNDR